MNFILNNRAVLSNTEFTSHVWLQSRWNVTAPELSVKYTPELGDLVSKKYKISH